MTDSVIFAERYCGEETVEHKAMKAIASIDSKMDRLIDAISKEKDAEAVKRKDMERKLQDTYQSYYTLYRKILIALPRLLFTDSQTVRDISQFMFANPPPNLTEEDIQILTQLRDSLMRKEQWI